MKRTMLTKEVDEESIIVGFDFAVVDPITTKLKVIELLKESDEYNTYCETALLIGEKQKEHILLIGKRVKTKEDETRIETLETEITELNVAVKAQCVAVNEKIKELRAENLIYFEPKLGEEIIEDDAPIDTYNNLKKNEVMKSDGTVIPNHKGKRYFVKRGNQWDEETIDSIGVDLPNGAKTYDELDDTEKGEIAKGREKKRISKLSASEKAEEKEKRLKMLLAEAAHLKTQYEILGEEDPLQKSKDWYNEMKAEIETKYA